MKLKTPLEILLGNASPSVQRFFQPSPVVFRNPAAEAESHQMRRWTDSQRQVGIGSDQLYGLGKSEDFFIRRYWLPDGRMAVITIQGGTVRWFVESQTTETEIRNMQLSFGINGLLGQSTYPTYTLIHPITGETEEVTLGISDWYSWAWGSRKEPGLFWGESEVGFTIPLEVHAEWRYLIEPFIGFTQPSRLNLQAEPIKILDADNADGDKVFFVRSGDGEGTSYNGIGFVEAYFHANNSGNPLIWGLPQVNGAAWKTISPWVENREWPLSRATGDYHVWQEVFKGTVHSIYCRAHDLSAWTPEGGRDGWVADFGVDGHLEFGCSNVLLTTQGLSGAYAYYFTTLELDTDTNTNWIWLWAIPENPDVVIEYDELGMFDLDGSGTIDEADRAPGGLPVTAIRLLSVENPRVTFTLRRDPSGLLISSHYY